MNNTLENIKVSLFAGLVVILTTALITLPFVYIAVSWLETF